MTGRRLLVLFVLFGTAALLIYVSWKVSGAPIGPTVPPRSYR